MNSQLKALVPDYKTWASETTSAFKESHTKEDCFNCEGRGESYCDCCTNYGECVHCGGRGSVWMDSCGDVARPPSTNRIAYRKDVIKSLLEISRHTGRSHWQKCKFFLQELERGAL